MFRDINEEIRLAWLALLGLMYALLRLRLWHPWFLPVTALLIEAA
jgi:hypothetical protein